MLNGNDAETVEISYSDAAHLIKPYMTNLSPTDYLAIIFKTLDSDGDNLVTKEDIENSFCNNFETIDNKEMKLAIVDFFKDQDIVSFEDFKKKLLPIVVQNFIN